MTTNNIGDLVYLNTVLANLHIYGVVTDPNSPNQFAATMELMGDNGALSLPALVGPQGPAGEPQFALNLQQDSFTSPAQLPADLTNTVADIGKYWLIAQYDTNGNPTSTTCYIWYGTEYRQLPMGSQGPPGPYPIITPHVILIDSDETSYIEVTGTTADPSWTMNLAVPTGPPGPSATLASCPDVNMSVPPTIGQVLGFNGQYNGAGEPIWQPMDVGDIIPAPYVVPESAFSNYAGITSQRHTVCTFQMPAQPWPYKPFVWGQLLVLGIDISLSPFRIGAEVMINNPTTGTLVGRGFGHDDGSVTIVPHTSSPSQPSNSMTPTNAFAQIPANTSVTFYVNLYNDGAISLYDFNAQNAQLSILCIPTGPQAPETINPFAPLGAQGSLTATSGS